MDLGLLVDAEHQGALGRVEVEADDVAHFLDEERVGRELEGVDQMGFEPEGPPDPATADWLIPVALAIDRVDQCVASAGVSSRVLTMTLSTSSSLDRARRPGARLVVQTLEALGDEASAATWSRSASSRRVGRHLGVVSPSAHGQHDATPQRQRLRALRPSSPTFERVRARRR